jgi:hypothetical protein
VSKIFGVIDFDQDGWVAWTDLRPILFPEMEKKKLTVMTRQSVMDKGRLSFGYQWEEDQANDIESHESSAKSSTTNSVMQKIFDRQFYLGKIFNSEPFAGSDSKGEGEEEEEEGGRAVNDDRDPSVREHDLAGGEEEPMLQLGMNNMDTASSGGILRRGSESHATLHLPLGDVAGDASSHPLVKEKKPLKSPRGGAVKRVSFSVENDAQSLALPVHMYANESPITLNEEIAEESQVQLFYDV